jgi:hypothetical protein
LLIAAPPTAAVTVPLIDPLDVANWGNALPADCSALGNEELCLVAALTSAGFTS